jgi:enoyl-CoA hydratase
MIDQLIRLDRSGAVPRLVIDRPETANSIDLATLDALETGLDALEADRSVRCVIVTGGLPNIFSAGGDIGQMRSLGVEEGRAFVQRGQSVLRRLSESRIVSIAAINGHALGGGAELALACDLRVAAEEATIGFPEVAVGLIPGWGGTQRAVRLLGPSRAKLIVLTARRLGARAALELGLVDVVVPRDQVLAEADRLASEILDNSPAAVEASKLSITRGADLPMNAALEQEADAWLDNFRTRDRTEGLTAFLEKRSPRWSGS